ncbi:hypothetical protein AAHA92_30710 [Salvia divinorum]|uniref:Uncharacterized protein n=1 Tax=Salvia divinorum TaxID=28513 RepID=A0ABD1FSA5_SALDI
MVQRQLFHQLKERSHERTLISGSNLIRLQIFERVRWQLLKAHQRRFALADRRRQPSGRPAPADRFPTLHLPPAN